MSKKYKAALVYGPKDVRIEKLDVPTLEPNEVLVKLKEASVCPTDIRKYLGLKKIPGPLILGHELAGLVEEVGERVSVVKEGDRVTSLSFIPCLKCKYCLRGEYIRCENIFIIGAGGGSMKKCYDLLWKRGIGGGFAEYIKLPEHVLIKVPPEVSLEEASVVEPLSCVLRADREVCKVGLNDDVVIIGAGPLGCSHVQICKALGASSIIVSDLTDERLELATKLGATAAINPNKEDPVKKVISLLGGGAPDVIIVATGGKAEAPCTELALKIASSSRASTRTLINIFAGTYPPTNITVDPNVIHYREVILTGSVGYNPRDFFDVIKLIKNKKIDAKGIRYPVMPLDEVKKAFEEYGKPGTMKIGIKID